ncbi:Flagellin is the subunit protein which polymerizes to form the filaments of bacterial flagella [Vibrio sp. B1FLJ16]|uniref:lateral flagellin LafA n=2 Tax=Vibrio sp. B1FLJ16 TaxID=2751178 RepID=UPI001AFC620D|nr:lateral flagellin LafA [Vibrio sp. B1FLJ16]CAD7811095.1 Flagellin is the subunit protein which polymerizes to form the filaments of bacterial flagella [Vibrio sp. B1FLJ16]CAD7811101.1 Flagellin is the subunit protein which polymerizes to form the filaments of bacterial flagella [Vibrio sp. B1FLJ16]CAE6914047.1 Flagellin is the subunit protein which polymerizes to form the filaments of bacterial flagella [Vibrio sp. B1FLJ16]CAE6914076.1 Flagellin is the subunit protein which polymerizes to fo
MGISVHTNYASLVTQNTLSKTNNALSTSMERLSTGYRINSAADDAAGLQIANRLETQTRGMNVAMRNAQDGISMMQTAEGAMDEVTNIAMRMNDLALQANNGSNSDADKVALNAEFGALAEEMTAIMENTSFGGQALLKGGAFSGTGVSFQIGATTGEKLDVSLSTALNSISGLLGTVSGGSISGASASAMIDALSGDTGLINTLGAARAEFGASINRLEHTVVNLQNMTENTDAAKGRIMDTDYASEGANMSKQQMLMQSGSSILSATKMVPQLAMGMLG